MICGVPCVSPWTGQLTVRSLRNTASPPNDARRAPLVVERQHTTTAAQRGRPGRGGPGGTPPPRFCGRRADRRRAAHGVSTISPEVPQPRQELCLSEPLPVILSLRRGVLSLLRGVLSRSFGGILSLCHWGCAYSVNPLYKYILNVKIIKRDNE